MIKYLGSKRLLVPVLGRIATAVGARTAVDLFTGTTRVAQEFKRRGIQVTAVDVATYAEVLARCYVATDARTVDHDRLAEALGRLNGLRGRRGYVTRTFCEDARFFRPENGAPDRRDARRHRGGLRRRAPAAAADVAAPRRRPRRLHGRPADGLPQAVGAPRANALTLRRAELCIDGPGTALLGDATTLVAALPATDLAYLDPPYNQHRYFTNYHVWETLVRWDAPEHYGIACKRSTPATRPPSRCSTTATRCPGHCAR